MEQHLTKDEARAAAIAWIANVGYPALRSCWNCNGAHEHLKGVDYVIWCYNCGHYFFKGVQISD